MGEDCRNRDGGREGSQMLCRSLLLRHGAGCTSSAVCVCVPKCVNDTGNNEGRQESVRYLHQVQTTLKGC